MIQGFLIFSCFSLLALMVSNVIWLDYARKQNGHIKRLQHTIDDLGLDVYELQNTVQSLVTLLYNAGITDIEDLPENVQLDFYETVSGSGG